VYNARVSSLPIEACPTCGGTGWTRVSRDGVEGVVRCECLKVSRIDRLLDRANIPLRYAHCDFESFHAIPSPDQSLKKAQLAAEKFVEEYPMSQPFGLLFMGPQGIGKTHLAVAIIKQLIKLKSVPCLFRTFPELLKEIQNSYNPVSRVSERSLLDPVLEAEVLVLDELGALNPSDWVQDEVAYVLNYRYNERKVTILTTNYQDEAEKKEKKASPGDNSLVTDAEYENREKKERKTGVTDTLSERIGVRMRSRLYEMCKTIRMSGEDFRKAVKQAEHHI
jgi:DNA replication protein DnaC